MRSHTFTFAEFLPIQIPPLSPPLFFDIPVSPCSVQGFSGCQNTISITARATLPVSELQCAGRLTGCC